MHFKSNSQSSLFFDEKGAVCLFYVTSTAKIHGKCPDLLVYLSLFNIHGAVSVFVKYEVSSNTHRKQYE